MFAKKNPLPEAWTVRPRRWYLKDAEFLSEIGGALAFLGLLLMLSVAGQRGAEAGETPGTLAANVFVGMVFICYVMMVSGGVMAVFRLVTAGVRPSYFRYLGTMLAGVAIANVLGLSLVWGVTRLILPLQAFSAWLAMTAGLSLLIVMRQRQKAAEASQKSETRPVE